MLRLAAPLTAQEPISEAPEQATIVAPSVVALDIYYLINKLVSLHK